MKIIKDYKNQRIRLTEERLQHILYHPEMQNMESAIEETIEDP